MTTPIETPEEDYHIPLVNLRGVQNRIEKLNRRAKKIGAQPIVLREVRRFERKIREEEWELPTFRTQTVVVMVVESGGIIKQEGWDLVGVIDHKRGNMTRSAPGQTIPVRYREAEPFCEHCQSHRKRNDTFLLIKDGDIKQVGRQCIADFLGNVAPERILRMAQWTRELSTIMEKGEGGGCSEPDIDLAGEYLPLCVASMRVDGYRSRSAANKLAAAAEERGESFNYWTTDGMVWEYLMARRNGKGHKVPAVLPEDEKQAAEALRWLAEADGTSDYIYNLKKVGELGVVDHRTSGLAASLIAASLRESQWQKDREERAKSIQAEKANSSFIGELKERRTFTGTIGFIYCGASDFGPFYIYNISTPEGKVIYKGSADLGDKDATITFKATIKKHDTYKGEKQTVVARPALIEG